MASARCLLSEKLFLCSICLDVFTDPITTPCGHNHCKTCITHYWDTKDVCQCPLCNKTFYNREFSEFSVNKVLAEMADQFRKNLEDLMCKKHDRPLELFCKTDCMCVCQFCSELDHKLHQIVSLEEAYEGKKAELGKTEAEVQQMIQERQQKIQEVQHSVELGKKAADREIADSVQVFISLISCIERSQAELIDVIEEKQKTAEKQAEGFIKEMQHEISELKKRSSEMKQLSHTEDHLHLLQNYTSINTPPPIKDWTKVNVPQFSYVETVRTAVAQLEKTLSQEMKKLCDPTICSGCNSGH